MGGEDGCDGSLGSYSNCLVDTDDWKQKNKNLTISPEQKTKKSFVLRHLSPVHKVLTGIWKPLSGQIVSSSIHFNVVRESVHECTFDRQPGNFQNYASGNHVSTSAYMLKIEKLITFNMTCIWTLHTNSLLHEYLFLMIMFAPYCYKQLALKCDYVL